MCRDPALAERADVLGRPLEDGLVFGEAEIAPAVVRMLHLVIILAKHQEIKASMKLGLYLADTGIESPRKFLFVGLI